jgi:hypothetical protein
MSDICSKIINEINNKNFNTALKLSGGYSENNDLHILNNLKGIIYSYIELIYYILFDVDQLS